MKRNYLYFFNEHRTWLNLFAKFLLVIGVMFILFGPKDLEATGLKSEKLFNVPQEQFKGIVKSAADNKPLAGVTVRIQNTNRAVSTDENGRFAIDASSAEVLEVSYVGFSNTQVTLSAADKEIEILLQPDLSDLDEVIVTGYSSQRRGDLTGSVSIVDADELKSQPSASAVEALQGKATGVQIVNDGAPGSTPQIKIRGYSTINNNEPLYIIDGVPFEGKLSWLNQNDIETMTVLKDASAASIYGSRANNGVVIITTKKGKAGKPKIDIESYVGMKQPIMSAYPKMLSPQQVLDLDNERFGTNETLPEYLLAGSETGNNITESDVDMDKYNYSRSSDTFYQITKANQSGTNWFKELSQNAPVQSYQLSANGGGENAVYAMSGGYLNQQGNIIHSSFKRFNVRTNTQFTALNNKLRFGENFQYSYTEGVGLGVNPNVAGNYMDEGSALGFAYRIQNIIPVYDEGGNFAGSKGGWGNGENPVALVYRAKDNLNRSNFFFGNGFAEYDLIDGLTVRTNFGIRYENYNGVSFNYPDPEFSEGSFNNGMSEYHGYSSEWTWSNTLNYQTTFNLDHSLNVLVGSEAIKSNGREISGNRNNYFVLNSLDYWYLDAGTSNIGNAGSGSVGSLFSLFAKADYSFKDRYLLSATVRRDGSSNFGENNLYGLFPGVSGAWRVSEEEFMKDSEWVSDLKFRAGYGITGNQRIPGFQYLSRFQQSLTSSSYPIGGEVTTGLWQYAHLNPDVKWEQVKSINLGIDFSIFDGRFTGSFDWYDKKTEDMLYRLPLPATAVGRAESPYVNVGSMSNKGVEFSLAYHHGYLDDKDFKFDISTNISRNVNEVLELAPSVSQHIYGNYRSMSTTILKAGNPFGSFYGLKVNGIYQSQDDVNNSPSYIGARAGGLKYEDVNGDGKIDDSDRTVIGNPHPDFVYSLNFSGSYKDFDFLMYFYGSQGNDLFEATRYFTDFGVFAGSKSVRLLDAWSPENSNSSIPSLAPTDEPSSYEYASSSYYVQDGSFLKLKNLQLGYNLDGKTLFGPASSLGKVRVYFGVSNVFTLTKYKGLDPEISATPSTYPALGVDFGTYPQARQYQLGINIGF
ncbi:MAG TPA: TonB-dependent receptor [Candidatus Sphingobacterium stercoripullorum]|nr:TonB-dependent receptor [Candidatus Sphingobacterium stercoripullorum]